MEQCKCCDSYRISMVIRDGHICDNCYNKLPNCAKKGLIKASSNDLKKIYDIIDLKAEREYILGFGGITISRRGIIFSNRYFPYEKLESVQFAFHPLQKIMKTETVVFCLGTLTLVVKAKNKVILEDVVYANYKAMVTNPRKRTFIQEKLLKNYTAIINDCIKYNIPVAQHDLYRETCRDTEEWLEEKHKQYKGFEYYRDDFFNSDYHYQSKRKTSQSNSNASSGSGTQHEQKKTGDNKNTAGKKKSSAISIDEAMLFFGLREGFTKEDLKKNRNILMKLYHPDGQGSDEMSKKVNICYEILEKIAK